jgi:hypothetical protein
VIIRQHQSDTAWSCATYSDCETYRYALTRVWDSAGKRLTYIMLNPSRATEAQNDPTIERCQRRAMGLGFGAFTVVNLFALRETDPALLRRHPAPVGPENQVAVDRACRWGVCIVCAWGVHGLHMGQNAAVLPWLSPYRARLTCLGLTKAGDPRHPLYMPYRAPLRPYAPLELA